MVNKNWIPVDEHSAQEIVFLVEPEIFSRVLKNAQKGIQPFTLAKYVWKALNSSILGFSCEEKLKVHKLIVTQKFGNMRKLIPFVFERIKMLF